MSDESAPAAAPAFVAREVPGDTNANPMPPVQTGERASLDTMREHLAAKNRQAADGGGRPGTVGQRIASFDQQYQDQSKATPKAPKEPPRNKQFAKPEPGVDPSARAEPPAPQEDPNAPPAEPDQLAPPGENAEPEAPENLQDQDALARYREWESSDMFPDEMLSKLHEVKVNGRPMFVDGKELRQGYMRGGDYRRQFGEAKQTMERAQQYEQSMRQHWESIRDPAAMLDVFEREGYGDTLLQVAREIGRRELKNRGIVHAAGRAAMEQYGVADAHDIRVQEAMRAAENGLRGMQQVEIERRKLAQERQRFEAAQARVNQVAKVTELQAGYEKQLATVRTIAFKAQGITDNAANRQAFARHMMGVSQTQGFDPQVGITRDMGLAAAQDLRDELESMHSRAGEEQKQMDARAAAAAARRGQPLPPGRMGAGGGKPLGGPQAQRGTLAELEAMVRKQRMGDPR